MFFNQPLGVRQYKITKNIFVKLLVSLITLGLFASIGCSLRIGEKPAQNTEINLGDQVGCLSDVGTVLSQFLNGKIKDKELEAFGECVIFSIQTFENYTVGEKSEEYHPKEIRHFLHQYFLKDKIISDAMLEQMMNLKILVLGGSKESITRSELSEFIKIIEIWKKEFVALNRYMKVYNWATGIEQQEKFSVSAVDAAIASLKVFVVNFLGTFQGRFVQYHWNDLEVLIEEFRRFALNPHSETSRPPRHWTLLIQKFQKLSFNTSESAIVVEDMAPLAKEMVDGLGLVIKYKYFLKGQKIDQEPGLTHLNNWVQEAYRLLNHAVLRHPNERIDYSDIHEFLLALENFFVFPLSLTADDIYEFFPKIFEAILTPKPVDRSSSMFLKKSFRRDFLLEAISLYSDWYEIQSHLSRYYPNEENVRGVQSQDDVWFQSNISLNPLDAKTPISDLQRIIRGIPPIYKKGESTVFLVEIKKAYSYQVSHDFFNLSQMNLYRTIINLAMRGYAKEYDPKSTMSSAMTAQELQGLYEDLKPLGIKVGLLDPRSNTAGLRSFNEANLFTYASDGLTLSAKMSFEEGMLLVGYLWSGSLLSKTLYGHLIQRCELGGNDFRGQKKIFRSCVEKNMGELIRDHVNTMPSLQKYLQSLDSKSLEIYAKDLLASSWGECSSEDWVEKSELNVTSVILHYVESVMTRFNLDANPFLEGSEINAAIPLFTGFIQMMGESVGMKSMDTQLVQDVFRHIVETGEIPEKKSWWKGLRHNVQLWRQFRSRRGGQWNPQLGRGHITSVFASIITKSMKQNEGAVNCKVH